MMQFVLTQYGVAPTDRTDAQYRQAQQVAHDARHFVHRAAR